MSDQTAYYSLIQFCPDPSRLEGVNVGVGLYSPIEKRVLVKTTRSNQRIRKFFGNQNWYLINRAKTSIKNQLRSQAFSDLEDFKLYISKRANSMQLSSPRSVRMADPQKTLEDLFERLVGPEEIEHKGRVRSLLTKKLKDAGVASMVRKSVKIEISQVKKHIRVPYGYQNGCFNLITPVQFDSDPEAIITKTGRNALEGKLLHEKPDPIFGEMCLVVVANFDEQIEIRTREFVKETFESSHVKLYSFDNLDPLLADIRHSAEIHGLPESTSITKEPDKSSS